MTYCLQKRREARARLRAEDPTRIEKEREYHRERYRQKLKHDPEYMKAASRRAVHRIHGITADQYDQMLADQGFQCAICGEPHKDEKFKRLHVDHCHETGKIRGLLCTLCNTALGKMKDDPDRLRKAADYIEASKEND